MSNLVPAAILVGLVITAVVFLDRLIVWLWAQKIRDTQKPPH